MKGVKSSEPEMRRHTRPYNSPPPHLGHLSNPRAADSHWVAMLCLLEPPRIDLACVLKPQRLGLSQEGWGWGPGVLGLVQLVASLHLLLLWPPGSFPVEGGLTKGPARVPPHRALKDCISSQESTPPPANLGSSPGKSKVQPFTEYPCASSINWEHSFRHNFNGTPG